MVPYNSSGPFKMEVPQSTVNVLKPLSYEFRVAEHVDEEGNIKKIGLQVRVWENGSGSNQYIKTDWKDVDRVQLPWVE